MTFPESTLSTTCTTTACSQGTTVPCSESDKQESHLTMPSRSAGCEDETSPENTSSTTCTTTPCPKGTTVPCSESDKQGSLFSTPSHHVESEDAYSSLNDEENTPSSPFDTDALTAVQSTPLSSAQSCIRCVKYQSRYKNLRRVNGRLKLKVSNLQMEVSSLRNSIKELESVSFVDLVSIFRGFSCCCWF